MHFVLPFYGHHQKRIKILLRRHAGGVDVKTEGGVLFQGDCPGVLNIKSAQCQQHNNNINNIKGGRRGRWQSPKYTGKTF